MRALVLLLSFVAYALCVYHSNVVLHQEVVSTPLYPNQIYYTEDTKYFSLPNIENPVSVEVTFQTGDASSQANICLVPNQANFPVPGNNLAHACPPGGFVVASNTTNTTTQSTKLKFTRTLRDSVKGQLLSKMVEDTTGAVNIYGEPSTNSAGFAVTTTSTTPATFTITLFGSYCDAPEFPVNGTCVTAKVANTDGTGNTDVVPAGEWLFYTFNSANFDPTVNNQINVAYNLTGNVYIQEGYLPTSTWNIGSSAGGSQVINTPGVTSAPTSWFVGFDNSAGTTDLPFSLNVTFAGCAAQLVGPGCVVNTTSSNSTLDGSVVIQLDASLDNNNEGDAISLDLSDDENQYVYFTLVNLPVFAEGYPYYVRVSVGNNNLEDDEDNFGPTLYAKLGGYPSAQSNDYAVGGAVANQVFLQVDSADDEWYLSVPTPADFSIWVGVNCAGDCDGGSHGSCLCSSTNGTTVACSAVANSTDYYALYAALPVSVGESAGACTCEDDDYAESFDCSQKSSPTVLFIVLIVIGGLIILFVAIGVPLYCYISNKRKERYERI